MAETTAFDYRSRASFRLQAAMLVVFILVCLSAGAFGGLAMSGGGRDWYASLEKPSWTPPSSIFGPVWTLLYTLMGIACWTAWRSEASSQRSTGLVLFWVQLMVNAMWSFLFFGLQSPAAGSAGILLLGILVAANTVLFFRTNRVAGALLVPYLAWVVFALVLNASLWQLNG